MRRIATLLLFPLLLTACPSNSDPTPGGLEASVTVSTQPPPSSLPSPTPSDVASDDIDLSGTWSGTWANTVPDASTGTFEIDWEQSLTSLEGTITIAASPCLSGGAITGSLEGQDVTFGAVEGEVRVDYEGSVNGDGSAMSGTYSTGCGDAEGTWEATKTG